MISIAASNLTQLIKQLCKQTVLAMKPCDYLEGTVYKISPLKIKITQKNIIGKAFIDMTTYSSELSLKKGDVVVLIRQQGGQKYLLIDKKVVD